MISQFQIFSSNIEQNCSSNHIQLSFKDDTLGYLTIRCEEKGITLTSEDNKSIEHKTFFGWSKFFKKDYSNKEETCLK